MFTIIFSKQFSAAENGVGTRPKLNIFLQKINFYNRDDGKTATNIISLILLIIAIEHDSTTGRIL
jgi:hypothetical protein